MAESNQQQVKSFNAGVLKKKDACVVLVRTEWNAAIVDALEKGCVATLNAHGVKKIITITVPGAVEIPFAIRRTWEERSKKKKPDAIIALGCVARGETPHFEYVCATVTQGVLQLNLTLPVPVIFGVLTVDSDEQAQERVGGRHGHKGEEAAITALKMIAFNQSIQR
jgi:6,7-dimethyl-8-ribityllumazine synthase